MPAWQHSFHRIKLTPLFLLLVLGCGKPLTDPKPKVVEEASPEVTSATTSPATEGEKAGENGKDELAKAKPAFSLTSVEFGEEFKKDRKAATARYQDKVIELKGTIVGAMTPYGGREPVLKLEGAKDDKDGVCFLPSEPKPCKKYVVGQTVTLRGRIGRDSVHHFLVISPCSVVEAGKSTADVLTAPQLDEECNKPGGDKKYHEKFLILTGTFIEKKFSSTYSCPSLLLKGGPDRNVVCFIVSKDESIDALKAGDTVKVQGSIFDTGATEVRLMDCFLLEPKK